MKRVYDLTLSEMDFVALCQRMDTEECLMEPGMSNDAKLEMDLRLSLFRNGFVYAMHEFEGRVTTSGEGTHRVRMNDSNYACGYSTGSTFAELAMEQYRQQLMGVTK